MMHRLQRRGDVRIAGCHIVGALEIEECRVRRYAEVDAAQRCEVSHFRMCGGLV